MMILNEIDELDRIRSRREDSFLVYMELYWAPLTEQIRNPDRFLLMFAPIFRSYTLPFDVTGTENASSHAL
ncbi:MAG: hypothetical protein ACLRSW_09750 [Christensenellaceae bacterium]